MIEAIITNYAAASHEYREKQQEQLILLEKQTVPALLDLDVE